MDSAAQSSEVMDTLKEIHQTQSQLLAAVESLSDRVGPVLSGTTSIANHGAPKGKSSQSENNGQSGAAPPTSSDSVIRSDLDEGGTLQAPSTASPNQRTTLTSRIVLTYLFTSRNCLAHAKHFRTYPKQIGINPLPMDWGNFDPLKRGPVAVSRLPSTIRRRNGLFKLFFTISYIQLT